MKVRRLALAGAVAVSTGGGAVAGNLETVQGLYAAFGAGDVPAILAELSPEVSWDEAYAGTGVPLFVPRRGPDEVQGFFEALSALEFRRFEVTNLLEGGNQVVAVVSLDIVVKATGKGVADEELHLWTFGEDGKVTAFRHFADTERMAAAFTP